MKSTDRLQSIGVRATAWGLRRLPRGAAARCGEIAGALYGRLAGRRTRIALDNLERAMGARIDPSGRLAIVRRMFRHFGRAAAEMLTMDRFGAPDLGTTFTFEGLDHIRSAYAAGGGVFLFSAHFGNWELVALMQGYMGLPLDLVTRPLDNPELEVFMRTRREASGNRVVGKRSAVRQALRAISEGRGVAIVIDQNVRSGARVFVDYFGRDAATTPTLALLALKTGAPIVPVFSLPGPAGTYRIVYGPAVQIPRTGDREADVRTLTQRCTKIIEEQVRAHPECWLWMHERWKSRPRPGQDAESVVEVNPTGVGARDAQRTL